MHQHPSGDELEYHLACPEALLAGTFALMTGHAQASSDHTRTAMAAKIAANLQELVSHSCLSPQFVLVLARLQSSWVALGEGNAAGNGQADPGVEPFRPQRLH